MDRMHAGLGGIALLSLVGNGLQWSESVSAARALEDQAVVADRQLGEHDDLCRALLFEASSQVGAYTGWSYADLVEVRDAPEQGPSCGEAVSAHHRRVRPVQDALRGSLDALHALVPDDDGAACCEVQRQGLAGIRARRVTPE